MIIYEEAVMIKLESCGSLTVNKLIFDDDGVPAEMIITYLDKKQKPKYISRLWYWPPMRVWYENGICQTREESDAISDIVQHYLHVLTSNAILA